jgi:tetratricopeptide (TPR) repeat protein
MDKIKLILILFTIVSCKQNTDQKSDIEVFKSNEELKEIYKADQSDRQSPNIDWSEVSERDRQRQERVYELLDSNLVRTSEDYANAAMVFQHGGDTIASGMAVKLMKKAVELDSSRSKWLLAAAIDRDLMRRGKPQIYGTQYRRMGTDEPWELYELDTTKVTDKERKEYGVETLAEQREKLRMMNKKKLIELLQSGTSIDEIIKLAKSSDLETSEYDLSESGINSFGYQLMGEGNDEDALEVFKMNTELYPEDFNTYDSYGECLVKIGRIEEGITAYKKSLELNPNNENAKKVLEEIEK